MHPRDSRHTHSVSPNRTRLIQLLAERSVKRGTFILASGRQSSIYIDARLTTMSPEGLALIGPLVLQAIKERGWEPAAIGGRTLGADPIAFAASYASASESRPLRAFTVRVQPKVHGTSQLIEGPVFPGDQVVIVDDVLTSGNSVLQAARAARETGAIIQGVLVLIDREEGGRERLEDEHLSVEALTTLAEITEQHSNSG